MSKYYQTKNFKELQKQWYSFLEKDGFEDAESLIGEELQLKQNAQNFDRGKSQVERESKQRYFELLLKYIHEKKFDNALDKSIMTMRAEGKYIHEICAALKKHRETIRFKIRKYENRWGIKKWKPEQMKKKWNRKWYKAPIR